MQAQVLSLLTALKAQHSLTYLFISHDLAVVESISDRIFTTPRHPYTKLLADSAPVIGCALTALEQPDTELPDLLNPPLGCAFAGRCPHATDLCLTKPPAGAANVSRLLQDCRAFAVGCLAIEGQWEWQHERAGVR